MIRLIMNGFDQKKAQYMVTMVHESGLALEMGFGLKDLVKDIVETINKASTQLELYSAQRFLTGQLLNGTAANQKVEKAVEIALDGNKEKKP